MIMLIFLRRTNRIPTSQDRNSPTTPRQAWEMNWSENFFRRFFNTRKPKLPDRESFRTLHAYGSCVRETILEWPPIIPTAGTGVRTVKADLKICSNLNDIHQIQAEKQRLRDLELKWNHRHCGPKRFGDWIVCKGNVWLLNAFLLNLISHQMRHPKCLVNQFNQDLWIDRFL